MPSRNVTGTISRVDSKPWDDKRTGKPITLHSFQLEGSNQWFRTGQRAIPHGVGQSVKFVADGANVDVATFEQTAASVVQQAPAPVATSVGSTSASAAATRTTMTRAASAGNRDDYWANKEARDVEKDARYQAVSEPRMALSVAVSAAAELVCAALAKDALTLGTTKAKRVGLLAKYTKEIALDLAYFIADAPNALKGYKPTNIEMPTDGTESSAKSSVDE